MMLLSALVAGIPNVAATTGNEAISLSSVTNSSASVDVANLDGNDSYYWWAFVYYPSGLLYSLDYGAISGVSGNASYGASWTVPTVNGTYSINCELTDFIGLSLTNTTSQFIIGGGGGTVLTPTATLSNLNTTSVTLDVTNLDANNSYYWWTWVFEPSGSVWYSSGYRAISNIVSGTYYPYWTDPAQLGGANGTYTVVGEIRDSNFVILDSNTDYFAIGTGLTGNEAITTSNITHVGANVTGTNLSNTVVYQWSVFSYFPSGSLHDSDSGIWNSPSSGTMTASAAWSPGNYQGNYSVSFRLYEYWNQTLLDTRNSTYYHAGTTNLTPDQYEPNDAASAATSIQVNSTTAANIHNAGQDDYFTLNLGTGSMNFVNLSFLHSTADLQLNVYYTNSIGNNILIDNSHGSADNEQVVFNLTTNSTIIIWVFSSGGTSWYNLSLESTGTPPPPPSSGDVNEPNDSFATATPISSPSSQSSLTIHNASDDDFFSISAVAGTTYWVNISFTHSQGDLDMDFYDSSQSQVDWSAGTGNSESVTYTPSTNQTLYAQVFGWGSATNTYSVTFGGLSSGGGGNSTGTGTEWVTITGVTTTNGAYSWGNLSSTAYYEIDWYWTFWNGTAHTIVQSGTNVPATTAGSTNQAHSAPTVGGLWCFHAQVWEQVGANWNMSDDDMDCIYHEILFVNHTSDTSGWIRASNLTGGASYTVDWYITDGNITTSYDQGNYSFTIATAVHNQTINFTNNGGGQPHCLLADIWDSANNLVDEVWECWTTAVTPPASGNLSVSHATATVGNYLATNLQTGTNYQTFAQYTYLNSNGIHTLLDWIMDNFTANGDHWSNVSMQLFELGGTYCLLGDLLDMDHSVGGTLIANDIDCWERLFIENSVTSDTGATIDLTNLTTGNTYDIDWYLLEGQNGSVLDSGTDQITLGSGTSHSYGATWSMPTTRTEKCFYTELFDSNGTLVDEDIDCFVPTLPDIEVTNLTNGGVTWSAYNLTSSSIYLKKVRFYGYANNTTHYDSGWSAFNATSGTENGNESWTVPGLSGYYCVEVILTLIVAGGIMDVDVDCISIIYDADGDGIWDQNDLCPNTPTGATVDQFGCSASQRDTDGDGYTDDVDDFVNDSTQWNDQDGDGYGDNASGNNPDAFPLDPTQWSDTDGDGYGDNPNGTDADVFPNDPTEWFDSDGDGYGDNSDAFPTDATQWTDIDGDGYGDNSSGNMADAFPTDPTQWSDVDGDGYGDNATGNNPDEYPTDPTQHADSDGDGYGDNPNGNAGDAFPNDPTQWSDSDGDGYGDNPSGTNPDAFPSDATQWVDSDGDGYGDNPLGNNPDAFTNDSSQWADSDGDGYGDNPLGNNSDAFPNDGTQWADSDSDGWGDNPQGNNPDAFPSDGTQWTDSDGDGYGDNPNGNNADQCPNSPAGAQVDENGCAASELDDDNDGVTNDLDACADTPMGESVDTAGCADSQKDGDEDEVSDAWDACPNTAPGMSVDTVGCADYQKDTDDDGISDDIDQCPTTTPDADVNGVGCAADERDADGDNIVDADDDCPNTSGNETANSMGCAPSQRDTDVDGVTDDLDLCPATPGGSDIDMNGCTSMQRDTDGDTIVDALDDCPATPAGEQIDGDGCADSQNDTDEDTVNDSDDICPSTNFGWAVDGSGCADYQKDGDGDQYMDNVDVCPNTPIGAVTDTAGCADTQRDSDNDGSNDAEDAFPTDPNEHLDSDGDGVGDNADAYPNDASRSAESGGISGALAAIAVVLLLLILASGVVVVIVMRRRKGDDEDDLDAGGIGTTLQPAGDIYAMAGVAPTAPGVSEAPEAQVDMESAQASLLLGQESEEEFSAEEEPLVDSEEPQTWTDDAGVNWCRYPDGSVMRYDTDVEQWVPHE